MANFLKKKEWAENRIIKCVLSKRGLRYLFKVVQPGKGKRKDWNSGLPYSKAHLIAEQIFILYLLSVSVMIREKKSWCWGDYILTGEIGIKVMIRQIINQHYARHNKVKAYCIMKEYVKGTDLIWEVKDPSEEEVFM